jgi:hypothetical protein
MNRCIALLGVALLWAGSAHAQDKTFTLTVTTQDLQVISAGLDELQRKVSEPLVEKLQGQLLPQMQPPAPPVVAPAPPPADTPPAPPVANPHPSF